MDKPRVHAPFSVLTIIEEEPTQTVSDPVSLSALAILHHSRIAAWLWRGSRCLPAMVLAPSVRRLSRALSEGPHEISRIVKSRQDTDILNG